MKHAEICSEKYMWAHNLKKKRKKKEGVGAGGERQTNNKKIKKTGNLPIFIFLPE